MLNTQTMYYKIEDQACEIYKQLHALRIKEKEMLDENLKLVKERVNLEFDQVLGYHGQQSFRRTTEYRAFQFTEPVLASLAIWKPCKDHKGFFEPNRRTKLGREMNQFLMNGLKSSSAIAVLDILELEMPSRCVLPYVEIENDCIYLFLDDKLEPEQESVIEITRKEFISSLSINQD
tara:strand:+ start:4057 stop:4587 length:531 start_codon:yes stop_codon:yes gene_type:complete